MTVICSITALLILTADWLVKYWIQHNAVLGEVFGGIPYIADFTFVKNTGAAFSMFSNSTVLLSIISIIFCVGLIVYWIIKKPKHPLLCIALSLIFAGAAGNAIDRIAYGYVVDFIDLAFMSFPVFNIADIAICCGAVLMVIYVIFFDEESKK